MSAWFRFCICSFEGTMNEYSSLAQSVEHAAVNRSVVGSSPTGGVFYCPEMRIEKIKILRCVFLFKKIHSFTKGNSRMDFSFLYSF